MLCVLIKILSHISAKKKTKKPKGSNFALSVFVFKWHHGSKEVNVCRNHKAYEGRRGWGGGVGVGGGGGEIIYLLLHCQHQNDSWIKVGSDESYFNVSLIVRNSHRTVSTTTTFSRERTAEAESSRGPADDQPNALPLGQTGSRNHTVGINMVLNIHRNHKAYLGRAKPHRQLIFIAIHNAYASSKTKSFQSRRELIFPSGRAHQLFTRVLRHYNISTVLTTT